MESENYLAELLQSGNSDEKEIEERSEKSKIFGKGTNSQLVISCVAWRKGTCDRTIRCVGVKCENILFIQQRRKTQLSTNKCSHHP